MFNHTATTGNHAATGRYEHVPGLGSTWDTNLATARAWQIRRIHVATPHRRGLRLRRGEAWCRNCGEQYPCHELQWANRQISRPPDGSHRAPRRLSEQAVTISTIALAPVIVLTLIVWFCWRAV